MKLEDVMKKVDSIQKGSFFRIEYQTEAKMTKEAKAFGHCVEKITEKTVRTGVSYHNIGVVKERDAVKIAENNGRSVEAQPSWFVWTERTNVIAKHKTKDNYYLAVMPSTKGGTMTKSTWFIDGEEATEQQVKDSGLVLASYWTKKEDPLAFQMISIDNIVRIGGVKK